MVDIVKDSREHRLLEMCEAGSCDDILPILKSGADVNARVPYMDDCDEVYLFHANAWCHPVHLAARNPDICVIQLLHSYGADLQVSDIYGWSPLAYAVCNNTVEMLNYLIAMGNKADDGMFCDGSSLMYLAWNNPHKDVRLALLALGVDVNNDTDLIPLSAAVTRGTKEDIDFLVEHGANMEDALCFLSQRDCPEENLAYFLQCGLKSGKLTPEMIEQWKKGLYKA